MVDDSCIAFDDAVHVEVASETSVRDLPVFEAPDGGFDGLGSSCASPEETHTHPRSSGRPVSAPLSPVLATGNLLATRLEVYPLVRDAVIARPRVDKYCSNRSLRYPVPRPVKRAIPLGRDG